MSLAKFVWMLQAQSLFFARSDQLGDPFEGHYTRVNTLAEDAFVTHQIDNGGFGATSESEEHLRRGYRMMLSAVRDDKLRTFVNCWHMDERESLAMWKLYAAHHEAVCIQSRYRLLKQLLPQDSFFGGVNYIDYDATFIDVANSLNFIVHKRASFTHEREVRAVLWGNTHSYAAVGSTGVTVPIVLPALIEAIYVSPDATPSYERTVANLAQTYGIDVPVNPSSANDPPPY